MLSEVKTGGGGGGNLPRVLLCVSHGSLVRGAWRVSLAWGLSSRGITGSIILKNKKMVQESWPHNALNK